MLSRVNRLNASVRRRRGKLLRTTTAKASPDPKYTASMYDEIENRLRIRGIEEPSKDLGTLKQILVANSYLDHVF
ncbi:hypothetical protein CASFOL_023925 [Castilleja foliolosa]|uniref:Uncharacterized protein n=1 Tax=Castilleja foliolosa TaxID=1961234 RepID=A0ABD3CPV2_9LAMI